MLPSDPFDTSIIIASLSGNATQDELRELEAWRARSSANEREYLRFARLWLRVGDGHDVSAISQPPSAASILARAAKDARSDQGPESSDGRRFPWRGAGRGVAAAAVLGAFGLATWSWYRERPLSGAESLVTGVNEVVTVTLQDQTVVRLAPSSRLTFDARDSRRVSLRGTAFFAVATDPRHPFRIQLASGDIDVLGTRFSVDSRDAELQVAVVEGIVRLRAAEESLNLTANDIARVADGGRADVRSAADPFEAIGWLGNFVAFESTPLTEVAQEFERRFALRLEIADEALRARTVTGWFSDQTPEMMVAGICTVVGARCDASGNVVTMSLVGSSGISTRDFMQQPLHLRQQVAQ